MRVAYLGIFLFCCVGSVIGQADNYDGIPKDVWGASPRDSARIEKIVALADSLKQVGELNESITLLKNIQTRADSSSGAHLIQIVQIQLADTYLNNDQPDTARAILQQLLNKYPGSAHEAEIVSLLGQSYRLKGNYEKALQLQERARALIDSARNSNLYSRINLNIGTIHSDIGNTDLAFDYYLRSIEGAEASGDSLLLSTSLNNLGVAYNNNGEPDKAQYYLERAITIKKDLNDRPGLLRVTGNLAISAQKLNDFDRSIKLYQQALDLHREVRKETPPFRILYNLGQVFKEKEEYDRALEYYQQSLSYCKQAGILQGLIYNYGGMANVAELQGDFKSARERYQKALKTARKIGAIALEQNVLKSLYQLEKDQQNFGAALSHYETYTVLRDSLDEQARKRELAGTETKLNLRKQEQINQLLQDKQRQQEARIEMQNWLIIAGIVIILVILASLVLLYRSNKERKEMNEELKKLNRVKDKMLAIISHDLRSPLSSMQGMLYLLREDDLSREEIADMSARLEVSLNQNLSMMDNLLAWSKEQMSGMNIDIRPVDARQIVEEVLRNYEFQADHKQITLNNNVAQDLKVKADFNLLKLILRNLISNSIKFSSEGDNITVSTRAKGGEIIFEVSDTGIGIPREKQDQLFTFKSGSRAGTQDEKGSGLGLQLCKEFVEKQDGDISVESEVGAGSTFKFSLPKAS